MLDRVPEEILPVELDYIEPKGMPSESHKPALLSDFRILIADDNSEMREYLLRVLGEHWTVVAVSDGYAAIDILRKTAQISGQSFDLVLTEVMMPQMDGFELLRILKADSTTNPIPVVMISGQFGENPENSHIEGIQAGADDYLIKPFSSRELIARVRTQLMLSKQRRALIKELNTMTLLHSIATHFVQEGNISVILLKTIDAAISITKADKGTIQLVDIDGQSLRLVASRGFSQSFIDHFQNCPFGKESCGTALQRNERVIVKDITQSSIFAGTPNLKPLLEEEVLAVQSTLLKNSSGKTIGMLSTHYKNTRTPQPRDLQMLDLLARLTADIIEREQWIQERAKWLEMLRESDRRKDNFLAILSHELRNPLASISNSSFMLSHATAGSDSVKRAQATIDRQLNQIIRLVDDLLDVTRITQNKIQLRCQRMDINELVFRTVEDHYSFFEGLGIGLQVKMAESPLMIHADSVRIAQVVSNLLLNASKFSMPGGHTQVSVMFDENKNQALIQVKDDGVGIAPDLLEHLFEPFMQADRSLNRSQGGLGLGLALVKGLVELHKGTVEVSSSGPGQGATFSIRLPIDDNEDTPIVKLKIEKEKRPVSRCVLLIEDNICAAESLSMVLEMFGHAVFLSYNGLDGIKKAKTIKPDFIFCDIGLPGIDGYEIAKILKADKNLRSTYLIALSGYAQPEDIEKSRIAGFDLHLAKPPNLELLEQLLSETSII